MLLSASMIRCSLIVCLSVVFAIPGCEQKPYSSFLVENRETNRDMVALFQLLDRHTENTELRFVLIKQISDVLANSGNPEKLILFLTTWVEDHPYDPYNAFYLLVVAETYEDMGAMPFAAHYYERILKNHPDLVVQSSSIHLHCLKRLLALVESPEDRIDYYKELISRFTENIDPAATYYFLARLYEEVGQWDQAIQTYKKYLQFPEAAIPGFPEAYQQIKYKVDFYNSDKSWTVRELQTLVDEIKRAIWSRNSLKLLSYKTKINFFTKSWEQRVGDPGLTGSKDTQTADLDIGFFLLKSRVQIDSELSPDSDSREAFLRTTGWHTTQWVYRIPTWYLYFRRIDYREDPEIDGRWEWAGIYFGERF